MYRSGTTGDSITCHLCLSDSQRDSEIRMKCFTIQSGDEYVADVYRPVASVYYKGFEIVTVGGEDEAKHYRNRSQAKSWLKRQLENMEHEHKKNKADYDLNSGNRWSGPRIKNKYESAAQVWNWLDSAEVIQLDLEKPNFDRKFKIVWDKWRLSNGSAGKSKLKIEIDTTSRHTCKSCGIKLKNIPYYNLTDGNPVKVCIPCLYIRQDTIKAAFEGMPEDFRTNIVNELILGSM